MEQSTKTGLLIAASVLTAAFAGFTYFMNKKESELKRRNLALDFEIKQLDLANKKGQSHT